jgi:pectate lyase
VILTTTTNTTKFTDAVTAFAANVSERCRDKYGAKQTPFLTDGINLQTGEPIRWENHILSNVACQQNFLRTLDGLTTLTGEPKYRQQAHEWIQYALDSLQDTASGMLYWGGHTSYDLLEDTPLIGNHELKCVYPYYEFLYQVDADATRLFIEGLWNRHIKDWSNLLFNRHGEYTDWERENPWGHEYTGSPLPILDNAMLSFINTGSDLIYAGAILSKLSSNGLPLQWAKRLAGRYDEIRNETTGLGGYQFNHRTPCRVRMSFKEPMSEREDVNETTVITNGVIQTRYGRAALTWMNLFEILGPEDGKEFLDIVSKDLTALAEHSYDAEDHSFSAVLGDGTKLSPENTVEGVGYCGPVKLEKVRANGLMFLSYAKAYRLTKDEAFMQMVRNLASGMGWGEHLDEPTTVERIVTGKVDGIALFGLLELYKATDQPTYLTLATALGNRLVETYFTDGFFTMGAEDNGYTHINSALPVALLQLVAATDVQECNPPTFYPSSTAFDPKVIIARRK